MKTDIKTFASNEADNYNTRFTNPFTRKPDPIPTIVLNRLQTRLLLTTQHLPVQFFESVREDFRFLYESTIALCRRQRLKVDDRAMRRFDHINNGKVVRLSDTIKIKVEELEVDLTFLYSVLDFVRNCEFESEAEPIIDLCRFAAITDKIFELAKTVKQWN